MSKDASIFHDLTSFVAEPRYTGLVTSPRGERVIATRSDLNEKKNAYVSALWELTEGAPARRLTRGLDGESLAGFTLDGDLLFTAKRETGEDDDEQRLFLLPRGGGEARVVARKPGGFSQLAVARESGHVVLVSAVHPRAESAEQDSEIAKQRKDAKATGILHTGFPVRHWDHDLGPTRDQIFIAAPLDIEDPDASLEFTQLSHFAPHERVHGVVVSPDGATVYASVSVATRGTSSLTRVEVFDRVTGSRRTLASSDDAHLELETLSPDGRVLLATRSKPVSDSVPLASELVRIDPTTGEVESATREYTNWVQDIVVAPGSATAYFTADHEGHGGIFRLDIAKGTVGRLTTEKKHYTSLSFIESSGLLVALEDAIDQPPLPVTLDPETGTVTPMSQPLEVPAIPGTLTEVTAEAADGTPLRAWLCLPEGASAKDPAPFLLWIHGGPFGSWNSWTWRWNPWTATARGYAVLLPDPAISTGYGQEMIDRGWDQLGGAPFDDIMRLTHAALEREDIDSSRKAALGGSYGGYMANWIAGHTGDFFNCIVTHASLWNLEQFRTTTDAAEHWNAHLSDAHNAKYNPASFLHEITQPMLVIHGNKDYRVPLQEGLRLWFELLSSHDQSPDENPHRFLYFPDENHWILAPNNSVLWYETVYAFLAHHVLGAEEQYPRLLG